jgi:hypothetical protein
VPPGNSLSGHAPGNQAAAHGRVIHNGFTALLTLA